MTRTTINHQEAGALILQADLRGQTIDELLATIARVEYRRPAHTATVRRIARAMVPALVAQRQQRDALNAEAAAWKAATPAERAIVLDAMPIRDGRRRATAAARTAAAAAGYPMAAANSDLLHWLVRQA